MSLKNQPTLIKCYPLNKVRGVLHFQKRTNFHYNLT